MPYNNVPASDTKKMDRCVARVQRTGKSKTSAVAICHTTVVGNKKEIDGDLDFDSMTDEQVEELVSGAENELKEKEASSVNKDYVPYGLTSFDQLREWRTAREQTQAIYSLTNDFSQLIDSIMYSPDVTDKPNAIKSLSEEFAKLLETPVESEDMLEGETKEIKWSADYLNELPDSAFLFVEGDETKQRKFPYKDKNGNIDLPHLRNVIAQIPKPSALHDRAQRILDRANKEIGMDEPTLIEKIKSVVRDMVGKTDDDAPMMIWKEESTGRYRWVARYSNNFRDDDVPAEIIAEKSHRRFVEMVDKGVYPLPELWLWHRPEWKIGETTAVAYDETGFAVATGYFDKGKEYIAEWLSKQKNVAVSHAMPPRSIVKSAEDSSVIIEHQTVEISPLPLWAAANKLTGFVVLDANKEADMAIPKAKRDSLQKEWGIDPALLDRLESQNEADAEKAKAEQRESKEANTAETTESAKTEEQANEAEASKTEEKENSAQAETNALDQPPSRREIADAIVGLIEPIQDQLKEMANRIERLGTDMKEVKADDEEKIAKAASEAPTASLAAMINARVIGRTEAAVDGRSTLAKSKPEETQAEVKGATGIRFIDNMIAEKSE